MEWVEKLAPENPNYHHHQTGEDNGDAHLKNLLLHHQVVIPITNGKFDAGPWQRIFYCEFDGQRTKRVIVKAIGEEQTHGRIHLLRRWRRIWRADARAGWECERSSCRARRS